jgi:hypothetical protein
MATERLRVGLRGPLPASWTRGTAIACGWCLLAAAFLLWPAVWNGYPIVFADTGTYLSQAIHRYAGWDRPVFYSLFIFPLHATLTLWPIIVAQSLIALFVLRLVCRILLPGLSAAMFAAGIAVLAAVTWLPFLVSEVMPDLFTPLLALLMVVLVWTPERVAPVERAGVVALAAFMAATQQSSIPLVVILLAVLAPLSVLARSMRPARLLPAALVPALAIAALCSVNLAAHHRLSLSPYGNVFYLARLLADGPGLAELRRTCPQLPWRLCAYMDRLPADSDDFLWASDSPLYRAGGPKMVSEEAGAIIAATVLHDPLGVARTAIANTLRQLVSFASGDGLEPWAKQVTPWLNRDFPAVEQARYAQARQQAGQLAVPAWLGWVHRLSGIAGTVGCILLLPRAVRRRSTGLGFLLAVLLLLPVSAAITGVLSMPHDRYQGRIMWLPPFIAVVCAAAAGRRPA